MEAKQVVDSSFDDIIFEGRNKTYGAYQLRQEYNGRLSRSAVLSVSVVLFLFGMNHAVTQLKPDPVEAQLPITKEIEIVLEPKIKEAKADKVLAAPGTAKEPVSAFQVYTPPKVVDDAVAVMEPFPDKKDFTKAEPGLTTMAGSAPDGSIGLPNAGSGSQEIEAVESGKPFEFVEQMPDFAEGGQPGMLRFINKHLRYPNQAIAAGLEGTVIITFVISTTGEVTQVSVLKDLGGGTGEEAMRVISRMPPWKPGIQNKRHVPVRMTIPIRFKLS